MIVAVVATGGMGRIVAAGRIAAAGRSVDGKIDGGLLDLKGTYRYFGYIDTLKYHDIS
jgi:hypothetical protein